MLKTKHGGLVVAVTGGAGFLGSHICLMLLTKSATISPDTNQIIPVSEIRIIDLQPPCFDHLKSTITADEYKTLSEGFQPFGEEVAEKTTSDEDLRLSYAVGSILDVSFMTAVLKGVDAVIHTASLVDFGQYPRAKIHQVNVTGTEVVLDACKKNDVKYVVYTSTTEVASWKYKPNVDLKETDRFPEKFEDFLGYHYGYSKMLAETAVREANGKLTQDRETVLRTVSLRPKGLYGEGDPYYLPNMLKALMNDELVFLVGSKDVKLEAVYIGNVAFAHLFLLSKLLTDPTTAAGEAYFLSIERKRSFQEFLGLFNDLVDKKLPTWYIPASIMIPLAILLEKSKITSLFDLPLNETTIRCIAVTQTVCGEKLKKLGFFALFDEEIAVRNTRKWVTDIWLPAYRRQQAEKAKAGWNIPVVLGTIIVAGAALGYYFLQ